MLTTILKNAKLIGIGAIAALLLGAGYAFGARKVHSLEEQIAAIKREGDDATARLEKAREEMKKERDHQDARYREQEARIRTEGEQKLKVVSTELAGAKQRIASLTAQVSVIDARRADIEAKMAKGSAAERQQYEAELRRLNEDKKALLAKVDGNQCLAVEVPETVIGPFMVRK